MLNYTIKLNSSAAKEFRDLSPQIKQRITITIEELKENPRPSGVVKLQGDDKLYRVRVGDYRIIFEINDNEKIIKITRIRHRQDVYKK